MVQEVNNVKINNAKYERAILNQVNNNSKDINIDVENRKNIDSFIKKYENKDTIDSLSLVKIKDKTLQLDKQLLGYGVAIKQRDEKNILAYSTQIENILDELFSQLNMMKK